MTTMQGAMVIVLSPDKSSRARTGKRSRTLTSDAAATDTVPAASSSNSASHRLTGLFMDVIRIEIPEMPSGGL